MPQPPASAHRRAERVRAAIRAALCPAIGSHLLVACSGGADSLCVAHAADAVARATHTALTIAHIRHNVRPDDARDAAIVAAFADKLGRPYRCKAIDQPGHGDENTLRQDRYGLLATMACADGASVILTGHTMDDQAETVLLHLLRGAGIDGLGGMRMETSLSFMGNEADRHAVRIIRPLLSISHAETIAYCWDFDLHYVEDPSNADESYTRNWLRHGLIPMLQTRYPAVVRTLHRSAAVVQDDADMLRALTDAAVARCLIDQSSACITLDYDGFSGEPPAMQRRIIRAVVDRLFAFAPNAHESEDARIAVLRSRATRLHRLRHATLVSANGMIVIGVEDAARDSIFRTANARHPLLYEAVHITPGEPVHVRSATANGYDYTLVVAPAAMVDDLRQEPVSEFFVRLPSDADLELRTRRPGDRFHPVARDNGQRFRDYLSRQHVPALVRDALPLLTVNGTIAWVLGYDAAAGFVVDPGVATHRLRLFRYATRERMDEKESEREQTHA